MEIGLSPGDGPGPIDWEAPWLSGLYNLVESVLQGGDWRSAMNAAAAGKSLCNHLDLPIQFVAQSELPVDTAYEAFISASGKVPTRDNLHDFFNALVWLAYPQVKRRLNALQAAQILASALEPQLASARGKLRDAATIFDENAALLVSADTSLTSALRAHRWNELFVVRRSEFAQCCKVFLFGHALMEKLTNPYKAITAHAWVVDVRPEFLGLSESEQRTQLDEMVSARLAQGLTTTDFTPLPVLGVPGWFIGQDDAFYADRNVFRPQRAARRAASGQSHQESHKH